MKEFTPAKVFLVLAPVFPCAGLLYSTPEEVDPLLLAALAAIFAVISADIGVYPARY
jgi:hypothetical protein